MSTVVLAHSLRTIAERKAYTAVCTCGHLVILAVNTSRYLVADIVKGRFSWEEFVVQGWFMVRVALLPTIFVAVPLGIVVAVQIGQPAKAVGASSFTGGANGINVVQQFAPVAMAVVVAGIIGSSMTSDLGARKIREEIDALMSLGISPVRRLVAPRLLAALVVSPLLTAIGAVTALGGTYVVNVLGDGVTPGAYLNAFVAFTHTRDLFLAEFKGLGFGAIVTIVCCHKGLAATGGPKGVANAVNQAVVLSIIYLAFANLAVTQAYAMLFPVRGG